MNEVAFKETAVLVRSGRTSWRFYDVRVDATGKKVIDRSYADSVLQTNKGRKVQLAKFS